MKMPVSWGLTTPSFVLVLPLVSCSEPTCWRYSINPAHVVVIMLDGESIWFYCFKEFLVVSLLQFCSWGFALEIVFGISFPFSHISADTAWEAGLSIWHDWAPTDNSVPVEPSEEVIVTSPDCNILGEGPTLCSCVLWVRGKGSISVYMGTFIYALKSQLLSLTSAE